MKMAILGRGKTGSFVAKVCEERGISHTVFHRENPPTTKALELHDVIISFLPGPALVAILDDVLAAKRPIVSGSTGADFPTDLDQKLKDAHQVWVQGHNFSLGMNLVGRMIKILHEAPKLFEDNYQAHIHEIHHTQKQDAPSGTALRWKEWLGLDKTEVTSERTGDVVGYHTLKLTGPSETITLTHEAHNRGLFADGAIWSAQKLVHNPPPAGFHWFEDLALKELFS